MNFSRQALLGIGMIIGGSVMLYAMVQQIGAGNDPQPTPVMVDKTYTEQETSQPLTTDIDTEKRILAQKQKERAARVAEQEKRAQQFLTEQETAEAQALAKSRAENQQYIENSVTTGGDSDSPEAAQNAVATPKAQLRSENTTTTKPTVSDSDMQQAAETQKKESIRQTELKKQAEEKKLADSKKQAEAKKQAAAEKEAKAKKQEAAKKQAEVQAVADKKKQAEEKSANDAAKAEPPKSATDYTVKSGDGLLKLARQYNMPVEALAQANNIEPNSTLQVGQTLTVPSRKQVKRLEREAATAQQALEEKRKKEQALAKKAADAQQNLREARKQVKETDAKGSFGVQVALATNQATADEMVKKLESAGYQVKTSATSRGVRVVIGPERGKVAAVALKDKINGDPKVNTTSAWVLYW